MKMYLDSDEWYPVLTLREEQYKWMKDLEVDVSIAFMMKYERIMAEFDSLQQELNSLPTTTLPKTESAW